MSATLSTQERATAILSVGILASCALMVVLFVGSVALLLGKGGAAAYQTVTALLQTLPAHAVPRH